LAIDAFVVIMNRHRQDLLGALLADYVLIKNSFNFRGFWHIGGGANILIVVAFFSDDIVAEIDAFITDVNGWTGDQLTNLVLTLPAEGADKIA
jgi:hypothetical protein